MSLDNPDFFYRQIVRLERCEDNGIVTFEISLDCGHEQSWMSWPMGHGTACCTECVNEFLNARSAPKAG